MDRAQYLAVMGACLLVTLPLELLLGARVYRRPRRTLRVLAPVVAAFYLWDVWAIDQGHWWFADRYVTGVVLPLGVPLEELVFFVVIPLCALLTFEAVGNLLDPAGRRAVLVRLRLASADAPAGHPARSGRHDGSDGSDGPEAPVAVGPEPGVERVAVGPESEGER